MSDLVDDKSPVVLPFIISRLKQHRAKHDTPFFIGLNGVQGVGKTTLVTTLQQTLSSPPHNNPTLTFSIDDLYLPRHAQTALAESHPTNPLVQHRGQPSTHDVRLGLSLFYDLKNRVQNVRIPSYDKSAHHGKGDRVDEAKWNVVNRPGDAPIDVVIFEGWCVGFRPLANAEIEQKWRHAVEADTQLLNSGKPPSGRLGSNSLESALFVNNALRSYDELTDYLDAFVFLDAENTQYVYDWRLEQERKMRDEKNSGMTDEQVDKFVDGYYPAYELFTERLRRGIFKKIGRQLTLEVGRDRRVLKCKES